MRLNAALVVARLADSRRKADDLIAAGHVYVNGDLVTDFSRQITSSDTLRVGETEAKLPNTHGELILFYKPVGYVCSHHPQRNQRSMFELLPAEYRHYRFAGRLDIESEGLMLLTPDGALIHTLTHPSFGTIKTYHVTFQETVSDRHIQSLTKPLFIEGDTMQAHRIAKIDSHTIVFELIGGKNRQIRKMSGAVGLTVRRLVRVSFGTYTLEGLQPGVWRKVDTA